MKSSAFSFPLFEALLRSCTSLLKARLGFLTFRSEWLVLVFIPTKCFVPFKSLLSTKFLLPIASFLCSECLSSRPRFLPKWFLPVPGLLPSFPSWTVSPRWSGVSVFSWRLTRGHLPPLGTREHVCTKKKKKRCLSVIKLKRRTRS